MEKRYTIAFKHKNMNPKDIIAEIAEVYHDDTLKKTVVYLWIG